MSHTHTHTRSPWLGTYQGGVGWWVGRRVPPHCLVDVDVVDKKGYELAEKKL